VYGPIQPPIPNNLHTKVLRKKRNKRRKYPLGRRIILKRNRPIRDLWEDQTQWEVVIGSLKANSTRSGVEAFGSLRDRLTESRGICLWGGG
jgi:hypothetical protein